MNEIKSNMDKLIESGKIKLFATKHNGTWSHKDWLEFCKELEASGLAPLDLNEVGLLLEKEKKLIKNKIKKINDISETKISKNQDIPKALKTQKAEKKQENEKVAAKKTNTLPELIQTHLPSLSEVTLHNNIAYSESSIIETDYKLFFSENFAALYSELIESILTACTKVHELNIKYYEENLNLLLKNK